MYFTKLKIERQTDSPKCLANTGVERDKLRYNIILPKINYTSQNFWIANNFQNRAAKYMVYVNVEGG